MPAHRLRSSFMSDRPRSRVNHPMRRPCRARDAAALAAAALLLLLPVRPASARHFHRAPPVAAAPPGDPGLRRLAAALAALRAGRRHTPVVVLQIGDSHTANDGFSGAMRDRMQARFGDGGRGVLPPGIPYAYFRPHGVQVVADGWERVGGHALRPGAAGPPLIGLTAVRQHAAGPARMTYTVDDPADFGSVAIEVLRQVRGGTLSVQYDDRPPVLLRTGLTRRDGTRARPAWIALPPGRGARTLTLTARGDGPVDMLGIDLRRAPAAGRRAGATPGATPGVIWANLGTVGAQVNQVQSWDPAIVAADLRYLRPDLIVLAFGTNEGFGPLADLEGYQARYTDAARRLLRFGGTLVVVEPPDGNRKVPASPAASTMASTTASTMASPADACGPAEGGVWAEPPGLAIVRRAEAAAALRHHWWAWDWSAAMGGTCSMARWAAADPPLAYPDHVHLREAGDERSADALFAALMGAMAFAPGQPSARSGP